MPSKSNVHRAFIMWTPRTVDFRGREGSRWGSSRRKTFGLSAAWADVSWRFWRVGGGFRRLCRHARAVRPWCQTKRARGQSGPRVIRKDHPHSTGAVIMLQTAPSTSSPADGSKPIQPQRPLLPNASPKDIPSWMQSGPSSAPSRGRSSTLSRGATGRSISPA